jgi:hypothetical protein
MSDEYLWNRGGEPDEEVARLEKLLGQFQHKSAPQKRKPSYVWLSIAAALVACVASAIPVFQHYRPITDWQLASGRRLRAGQVVETGALNKAAIESQFTGHVDVEPHSRLRVIASRENEQRFSLERGTIHALIWAPPGRFVVDTPSSKTIDLGCRYTLQVSDDGTGLVSVETGWVAFEWQRHEAFIPAGAACVTRPKLGPGTHWFSDAPEALKSALSKFDTGGNREALSAALNAARERDALSVWHLMARTQGTDRGQAFDRFATLVKLPPTLSREAVLRGDAEAVDAAWNALDLGSTDWWREWKRKW